MEQVIENIRKKIPDPSIQKVLIFFSSVIYDTQLKNLLLKSFLQYPHYDFLRKEVEIAVKVNAKHLNISAKIVPILVSERLSEVDYTIKDQAEDCFNVFTAKLKYSVRYRHLLDTPDFNKLEIYLRGSYV